MYYILLYNYLNRYCVCYDVILYMLYCTCYSQFIIFYYIISTSYYMLLLFSIQIEVYILYIKTAVTCSNMLKFSTYYYMLLLFIIYIIHTLIIIKKTSVTCSNYIVKYNKYIVTCAVTCTVTFKICLYHISHCSFYNNYHDLLLQRNKHYSVTQGLPNGGCGCVTPPPPPNFLENSSVQWRICRKNRDLLANELVKLSWSVKRRCCRGTPHLPPPLRSNGVGTSLLLQLTSSNWTVLHFP